jgi:4-alpha-glucanotransferase
MFSSPANRTGPALYSELLMAFPRAAGVLLHPTSLPSAGGIGDLGPEATRFVDWLHDAGLGIWQMLPLGPTGYGDSPYQCFSAFAGNPLLIHIPEEFAARHTSGDRVSSPVSSNVDFAAVHATKPAALRAWLDTLPWNDAVERFAEREAHWLPDYALFMAIKESEGGAAWTAWPRALADREPEVLHAARQRLAPAIRRRVLEQFVFDTQFRALRDACAARGVRLMGDVPIYVAHDSADVWTHRDLFQLQDDGTLIVQAGVPPDYFSATGQLWGNPLYDWPAMANDNYAWWTARLRRALDQFDVLRLDHFRGFAGYWEVPGNAQTAVSGRWVNGPGEAFFAAMHAALGPLPIVAEDLGLITPDVTALRERCGFPGMAILQFAFASEHSDFQPHRFVRDLVVYTGTHDNDTTMGWWESSGESDSTRSADEALAEKSRALRYLNCSAADMPWALIRAALASVADTVLIPMQDVLALGSDARMNLPGRSNGNWAFRFSREQLDVTRTQWLRELVRTYER